MKKIALLSLALPAIAACNKDKNNSKAPEEYFSFYADGVYYDYPQEEGSSIFVDWKTLSAGASSATIGYQIHSYSRKNPVAEGAFSFIFSGNHIPTQDTILLDGVSNNVEITKFRDQYDNWYKVLEGKLIFSQRNADKLIGTFQFTIAKGNLRDTLYITNGKFSIIPAS